MYVCDDISVCRERCMCVMYVCDDISLCRESV